MLVDRHTNMLVDRHTLYICMHTHTDIFIFVQHFVCSYPVIEERVQRGIGGTLFAAFMVRFNNFVNAKIASVKRLMWTLIEGSTNRSDPLSSAPW